MTKRRTVKSTRGESALVPATVRPEPALLPHARAAEFRPKSDVSRRLIDGETVDRASLAQSYLIGTVIRRSDFRYTTFDRCDLDGAKVEHSTFHDSGFVDVDMRGAAFNDCVFERCTFSGALIEACVFVRCRFGECSFEKAVVSDCTFQASELSHAVLSMSTWRLNRFTACRFVETPLGDCTFLYAFFAGATFERSAINLDAIGLSFGLTAAELTGVGLIYLGAHGPRLRDAGQVDRVVASYAGRGMALHEAVARLNFKMAEPLHGVTAVAEAVVAPGLRGLPVQRDDVRFVVRVFEALAERHSLPLLACVNAARACEPVLAPAATEPLYDESVRRPVAELVSGLTALATRVADEIDDLARTARAEFGTEALTLRLRYGRRPDIDVCALVNGLAQEIKLPEAKPLRRLSARQGSYVEFLAATAAGGLLLLVTLCLVNGVVDQLIVLRGKVRLLLGRRRLPDAFRQLVHRPMTLDELPVKKLGELARLVNGLEAFRSADLSGVSPRNLREVAVVDTAPTTKPVRKRRRPSS